MTRELTSATSRTQRTATVWGITRSVLSAVLLILVYFLGPLEGLRSIPLALSLTVAAAVLVAISAWQIQAIKRSPSPRVRGVEALAVTVPLYILIFAATYYGAATIDPTSFNVEDLSRMDSLYFTVTTFVSVGFGDIYAASQDARLLVTVQMTLNLLVLGAGIRVFVGAARRRRGEQSEKISDSVV